MNLNWSKSKGEATPEELIPAIIQDSASQKVLMLGYMNREALELTEKSGKVTFFSRTRNALWEKGETSGNFLRVEKILPDCDSDALLILVKPEGPTCHRSTPTCFDPDLGFLETLEKTIQDRMDRLPEGSYVSSLVKRGLDRIIQKVGEEGVETVIAAKNENQELFEGEASDLLFHLLVLLRAKGSSLGQIIETLKKRHS